MRISHLTAAVSFKGVCDEKIEAAALLAFLFGLPASTLYS